MSCTWMVFSCIVHIYASLPGASPLDPKVVETNPLVLTWFAPNWQGKSPGFAPSLVKPWKTLHFSWWNPRSTHCEITGFVRIRRIVPKGLVNFYGSARYHGAYELTLISNHSRDLRGNKIHYIYNSIMNIVVFLGGLQGLRSGNTSAYQWNGRICSSSIAMRFCRRLPRACPSLKRLCPALRLMHGVKNYLAAMEVS